MAVSLSLLEMSTLTSQRSLIEVRRRLATVEMYLHTLNFQS